MKDEDELPLIHGLLAWKVCSNLARENMNKIARVMHSSVKMLAPRSACFVPLLSRDSMKAALICSLSRISCGVTHFSGENHIL